MVIQIQVDEKQVKQLYLEKIEELIKGVDREKVFWDSAELKRRTCMSWNTIQDTFFHDPRFKKVKIGGKWYFPAEETRKFLLLWLEEQRG